MLEREEKSLYILLTMYRDAVEESNEDKIKTLHTAISALIYKDYDDNIPPTWKNRNLDRVTEASTGRAAGMIKDFLASPPLELGDIQWQKIWKRWN